MKKEISGGVVAAVIGGLVVVVGLFYLVQWMRGGGQSPADAQLERIHVEQAKSEYGRYSGATSPGGEGGGPPQSGEGAAQAAYPGGTTGN